MTRRLLRLGMVVCALPLAAALYDDFKSPPDAARPWCYWYWVNGNVDRETVTADLEAMKKIGFGGVLMFDPRGYDKVVWKPEVKLAFGSSEWRQMVAFAVQECARLGLEFTMNLSDCGGSLKGPWKTGADGPKRLVCGVNVKDVPVDYNHYSDIATVEVVVPADEKVKDGWRNAGGVVNRWERDRDEPPVPLLAPGAPGGRKVTLRFGDGPAYEFDWSSPMETDECLVEDSTLLPFSEIMGIAEKRLPLLLDSYARREELGEEGLTVDIDRIDLGLWRIREKDSVETGLLVPAWCFYLDMDIHTEDYDGGRRPEDLLIVNAVNGTLIDPWNGY